jgi:hypothetical protein
MTDAASILAAVRAAIEILVDANDQRATHVAEALSRWMSGEDFEQAAGLSTGWRRQIQQAARDRALTALVALHPSADALDLARQIVVGLKRAARTRGVRPDSEGGLLHDLARLDDSLSERSLRRAITEIRGQCNSCDGHGSLSHSLKPGDP